VGQDRSERRVVQPGWGTARLRGRDGTVKIRNSRTGKEIQTFSAHAGTVVSVAFHPDGEHVASVGADRKVKVWNLTATGQPVFDGPCDAIRKFGTAYTVAFSPDGRKLAAGSDGDVRVWEWMNRQLLHTLAGHRIHSVPVAFSRDGRRLATAGAFQVGPMLWDLEAGGQPLRTASDPNRADDPEYIVRLVGQVVRVSVETVRIVKELPAAFA